MRAWLRHPRRGFYAASGGLAVVIALIAALGGTAGLLGAQRVAGAVAAVVGLGMPLLAWLWRQGSIGTYEQTAELTSAAARALARAQREQWSAEEMTRQVRDPWPLPVRWAVTARTEAMMASWPAIRGTRGAAPVDADGQYAEVASVFRAPDAPGRMAIVGAPGAGKSVLVIRLALDLLKRWEAANPQTAGPVPVLVPVATWNSDEPLDDWLARRLAADDRGLARPVRGADGSVRTLARELVRGGRVLPILDGLDELAAERQADALRVVADSLGPGRQLVLTSRTAEYEAAAATAGPLARTPVVELLPLDLSDVVAYVTDGTQEPRRWAGVFAHLQVCPQGPLGTVLTSPLMAWLARTVYQHRGTDPDELLAGPWARSGPDIERHLLGRLVPVAYGSAAGRHAARTAALSATAQRWLAGLARHMTAFGTAEIAWWRLHRMAGRGPFAALTGLATATLYLTLYVAYRRVEPLGGGRRAPLADDIMLFLPVALVFAAAAMAASVVPTRGARPGVVFGGVVAAAAAVEWFVWGGSADLPGVLSAALVYGVLYGGFAAAVARPRRVDVPVDRRRFATGLRAGLVGALGAGAVLFVFGMPFAEPFLMTYGVATGGAGLAVGTLAATTAGGYTRRVPDPAGSLAADRAVGLGVLTALGLLLIAQPTLAPYVIFGMVLVLTTTQWARFGLARAVLAARGVAPLRLVRALAEAHDRGILRQAGDVYQFRHARLQYRLADGQPAQVSSRSSG